MTSNDLVLLRKLFKTIFSFALVILLWLTVRWTGFEPYVIPSGSMIPTLQINDHIVVSKWHYGLRLPFSNHWLVHWGRPSVGDIVVFNAVDGSGKMMVKRVAGVPGSSVDGRVLAADEFYMLGDNSENSLDSRYWGTVPIGHIIGKARWIWLACKTTLPQMPFLCDPSTFSWERMFKVVD